MNNNNPKVLAVVPAKKKSIRLPGKNLKKLGGHPLIAWTIDAAKKSKKITHLVVSSDCPKTCEIAKKYGALVPYLRPQILTGKNVTNYPVVMHALKFMEKKFQIKYDIILLLQPTCPVRSTNDIDRSIYELYNSELNTVVSVKGPYLKRDSILKWIDGEVLKPWCTYNFKKHSNGFYIYNASIYGAKRDYFFREQKLTSQKEVPIIMNKFYSIDIDDKSDLIIADTYLKHLKKEIKK
tara:strand:+ start:1029 stop:1739 length:711 start_codon:yes stop_codon:yes gene_type:complete